MTAIHTYAGENLSKLLHLLQLVLRPNSWAFISFPEKILTPVSVLSVGASRLSLSASRFSLAEACLAPDTSVFCAPRAAILFSIPGYGNP